MSFEIFLIIFQDFDSVNGCTSLMFNQSTLFIYDYQKNLTGSESIIIESNKAHNMVLDNVLDEVQEIENAINELRNATDLSDEECKTAVMVYEKYEKLSTHQKKLIDSKMIDKLNQVMAIVRIRKINDKATSISVESLDIGFLPDTALKVELKTDSIPLTLRNSVQTQLNDNEKIVEVYDIVLLLKGIAIQPEGNVKIKLPLNEKQRKYKNIQVIHIADDGKITRIDTVRNEDSIEFIVEHFSYYAIIGQEENVEEITPVVTENSNQATIVSVNTSDVTSLSSYGMMLLTSTGVLSVIGFKRKEESEKIPTPDCFIGFRNKMKFARFLLFALLKELRK